jgi:hypothetical protein
MTPWAPVAPVGAADSAVALLPRAGGEDVVTWDGTWLSYYRFGERPELRWRRALHWTFPRLRANSYLLVVAAGPELVALERESGRELWRWSIPVRAGGYWPFDGDSHSFQQVCVSEKLVVAAVTRTVFAFDAHSGAELWSFALENDLRTLTLEEAGVGSTASAGPSVPAVFVSATHYSGRLFTYTLDPTDGRPRVEAEFHDLDARSFAAVAVGHSLWYIESERKRVTAYDLARGTQLWREAYGDLNLAEYLAAGEGHLFFVLRPPRGQPPRLLAVEKATGARAFVVDSPQFQYSLRPEDPAHAFAEPSFPGPYHVLTGEDVGLEAGPLLLCQQGTDLVAWRAYRNDEAARWPLFAEQEVLTGIARRGRLLFLAVGRPLVPALLQGTAPSGERPAATMLLMQPTVRVVELPAGTAGGQVALPPATAPVPQPPGPRGARVRASAALPLNVGIPLESVVPVQHGLLSEGEAGLIFLAAVGPQAALGELRTLRQAGYLNRGERVLLETLIASLDPVELTAQPCGQGLKVAVDGDLSEWAGVPALHFAAEDGAWVWSFPEVASAGAAGGRAMGEAGRGGPTSRPAPATEGSIRLAWDAENLYVAIEVRDSDHHPPREAGAEWRSDSVALRVVPQLRSMGWRSSGRFSVSGEVGRARVTTLEGPQAPSVRAAIGRGTDTTTYELAIARGSLSAPQGAWPPPPRDLRLTLSVSNRDEAGLSELLSFPPGPIAGRGLDTLAGITFAPAEAPAPAK